jgi:hypothetical protein
VEARTLPPDRRFRRRCIVDSGEDPPKPEGENTKKEGGDKTLSTRGKRQNISTAGVQPGSRYILITRETCGRERGPNRVQTGKRRNEFTKKKEKKKKGPSL